MKKLQIYTDGGSRGNPGKSAVGVVVFNEKKIIYQLGKTIGVATNNVAEYKAVDYALNWLLKFDEVDQLETVEWFLDSKLVVEQLNGKWKIKNSNMQQLAAGIWKKMRELEIRHVLKHIPREKNHLADALVNEALDSHLAKKSS